MTEQVALRNRVARPDGDIKAHLAVCENCEQYIRKNKFSGGWTAWFHISSGIGACNKRLLK